MGNVGVMQTVAETELYLFALPRWEVLQFALPLNVSLLFLSFLFSFFKENYWKKLACKTTSPTFSRSLWLTCKSPGYSGSTDQMPHCLQRGRHGCTSVLWWYHGLFLFLTIISNPFFPACCRKKKAKKQFSHEFLGKIESTSGDVQVKYNLRQIRFWRAILTLHDWKPPVTVAFTGQWKYLKEIILSATRNKKLGRQRNCHPFCADFTLSDSFWLSPSFSSSLTGQVASPSPRGGGAWVSADEQIDFNCMCSVQKGRIISIVTCQHGVRNTGTLKNFTFPTN